MGWPKRFSVKTMTQMEQLFPPIQIGGNEKLKFFADYYDEEVLILMPNQDSYVLSYDRLKVYLKMLGDKFPDRVMDFVKNFGSVLYSVIDYSYMRMDKD